MTVQGTETAGTHGGFVLDSVLPADGPGGLDAFRRGWETQIGNDVFRLPSFSPDTMQDFRAEGRVAKVGDAAIADLRVASATRTTDVSREEQDLITLYVVRRGAWTLDGPRGGDALVIPAGRFLMRRVDRLSGFETTAHIRTKFFALPAPELKPLLTNHIITGPVNSGEVRLLTAFSDLIHTTMSDLGVPGVKAARDTLVELAKAVAKGRFDDVEPRLAPALVQAAKEIADRRLADPELSTATLARALNVSTRTLQRAFATVDESVTAYIRSRRLEKARHALTLPSGRPSMSELAAHWQFADGSHFTRAFKKEFGQTPTEYARSHQADPLLTNRRRADNESRG